MAAAAIPIAGALVGAIQGDQQARETDRFNRAQAEISRFGDVTGRFGKLRQDNSGGALGGAIKGAASFGSLGSAFGGLGGAGGAAGAAGGAGSAGQGGGAFGGLSQKPRLSAQAF